jgi:hypothetical protein
MFLTEYNVRGSTVLPKQSITIAFSTDPRNPYRGVNFSRSRPSSRNAQSLVPRSLACTALRRSACWWLLCLQLAISVGLSEPISQITKQAEDAVHYDCTQITANGTPFAAHPCACQLWCCLPPRRLQKQQPYSVQSYSAAGLAALSRVNTRVPWRWQPSYHHSTMAEESGLSEAELQAELEQMEAEGDEAMADVTVEDAVRAPTPPAPLALDEGAGVADTTTPKSPYRAPRDPVPLGKYTAVKISKIRAHPEMDSEEEGNYMKGDEFEVTEVVEVSGKTGQAPRVRGRTEMGWITLRLGDNVDKVEEASPRKGQKGGADKLGEYLILGKKGAKLREGPELDSALCAYALEKGEVKEVTEVKVVTNTAGKDVVRGHCSEGWFTIKDGMVEHLAMDAASPGKSPKNKGQGGRRGSVAQDGTSQVVNAAADIASQLGAVQEKQFAVVQGHLKKVRKKKVSENCVLKVGSMSLVLFDGPNPLETYLYTTIKRWCVKLACTLSTLMHADMPCNVQANQQREAARHSLLQRHQPPRL